MKKINLDPEEKELMAAIERDEFISVTGKELRVDLLRLITSIVSGFPAGK